jgi:cation:H+ antiporter
MAYLLFVLGLVLLVGGGELLVQSGIALANKLRLPPLIIGIVLMGVGTSLPELSASLSATLSNPPAPGIAFGNVIGSNISNVLFILGLAALIHPIQINRETFRRDGLFILLSVIMLGIIMAFGYIDSIIGIFLLLFIAGYFVICYDKQEELTANNHVKLKYPAWRLAIFSAIGIALIVFGADLLVDTASKIADTFGISKSVMGLTLIAFGTSLPEVTVSTVAALHRQSAIAFGNVVGSNIANIFLIVGAMGVARTTEVPKLWDSFWIMAAVTALLLICGIIGKIPRWAGLLFLAAYAAYICFLFK